MLSFLAHSSVWHGCIWDIDQKERGQNVAFFFVPKRKALSMSLGFLSVLSAEHKMFV